MQPNPKIQNCLQTCADWGFIPTEFKQCMTWEEQVLWLFKFLNNTVIPTLNTDIENVEALAASFNALQQHVDNYFDNLDVQEEINNKLDEMAEDGTLATIISSYIMPVFNDYKDEVDDEISSIRTQLSTMASGTPIPVSSTSDMTDHTKVYVNTTDGNWYYYDTDTSTWTSGGTYQSTGIGEGTVSGISLYNGEKSQKYYYIQNYTFDTDGSLIHSQYREYCDEYIPISTGDTYEITNVRGVWCCLYDSDKNFLYRANSSDTLHTESGTVSVADVAYMRVTFYKETGPHTLKINGIEVLNNYSVDWLKVLPSNLGNVANQFDGSILKDQSVINEKLLLTNGYELLHGEYWTTAGGGPTVSSNVWSRFTTLIPVKPGDIVTGKNIRSAWLAMFDENGDIIANRSLVGGIGNDTYVANQYVSFVSFNIADNVKEIASLFINGKQIPFDNGLRKTIDWLALNDEQIGQVEKTNVSRFKNYKTLFIGDSITEKNFRASKNWVDYITEELGITSYLNGGMSGTGIIRTMGSFPNWLTRLQNYSNDYDMILIMGDMNDWSHGTEFNASNIGQYGDSTTATFYGTMKVYLEAILAKYPLAKIGWITSTPRNQLVDGSATDYLHGKASVFEQANSVIKEMCNNYSIPVLELYEESSLYPWISANNNEYFKPDTGSYSADGVHPNSKGQRIMAYKIKDFIIRNF